MYWVCHWVYMFHRDMFTETRQILSGNSGFKDAPPTRKPSMSSHRPSSNAFLACAEPPYWIRICAAQSWPRRIQPGYQVKQSDISWHTFHLMQSSYVSVFDRPQPHGKTRFLMLNDCCGEPWHFPPLCS